MSKKRKLAIVIAGVLLIVCGFWAAKILQQHEGKAILQAPNRTFRLEIADTDDEQRLGLGDRDALGYDDGMLFVYPNERRLCFWMKDMRIPIDMIWLDGAKKVLKVEANVKPETYPKDFCADNAQYVIELNANVANGAGVEVGQTLKF